jgi:hypothetical protein
MEDDLQWKTNYNGRQNFNGRQNLNGRQNFNGRRPPMEDDIHWKTTTIGRQHIMEDDLKISKIKYISATTFWIILKL